MSFPPPSSPLTLSGCIDAVGSFFSSSKSDPCENTLGNVWGYRNDLKRAGMQRSIFQALLFMHRGGVVLALPGPEVISKVVGILLNYIGGVFIGKILLGYQDTYPEYYREKSS